MRALVLVLLFAACVSEEDRATQRRLDRWLESLDAREGVPYLCDRFADKADAFRRARADGTKVRRFVELCAHDAPVAWAARELASAAAGDRAPACEEVALALLDLPDDARRREHDLVGEALRRCCPPSPSGAMRTPCARLGAP
ncbi:MAG TPA: hypothetical protein VFF06_22605 [Polyangia bacterium]|nr:hypothetical protein [Polyangia bacterium]